MSWLGEIDQQKMDSQELPLARLLNNSMYYPACRFDGDPVKLFGSSVNSFIYADYGATQDELAIAIAQGFKGYDIFCQRDVRESELKVPMEVTNPSLIERQRKGIERQRWFIKKPFAHWCVFQRKENYGKEHGPSRFSLFYICADGAATYQALYVSHNVAPKILSIIQPGHGFGGNWDNYSSQKSVFYRVVMDDKNVKPEMVLLGEWGSHEYLSTSWGPNYQTSLNTFSNPTSSKILLKYNKNERFQGEFTDYFYEMVVYSESDHLNKCEDTLVDLWKKLRSQFIDRPSVSFYANKYCVVMERDNKFIGDFFFRRGRIGLFLFRGFIKSDGKKSKDFLDLVDPKWRAKEKNLTDKSSIIHSYYIMYFNDASQLEDVVYLINQKYESLG